MMTAKIDATMSKATTNAIAITMASETFVRSVSVKLERNSLKDDMERILSE